MDGHMFDGFEKFLYVCAGVCIAIGIVIGLLIAWIF